MVGVVEGGSLGLGRSDGGGGVDERRSREGEGSTGELEEEGRGS